MDGSFASALSQNDGFPLIPIKDRANAPIHAASRPGSVFVISRQVVSDGRPLPLRT
jgi:hypothetical protein